MSRVEQLVEGELATLKDADLASAFAQPASAIDALTADLLRLWVEHRSGEPNERAIGSLGLSSGVYLQWIGYSDRIVLEVSCNTYLDASARLSPDDEQALVRAGFSPPNKTETNFWWHLTERAALPGVAFSIVAVLTAVFGVYAG